MASLTSAVLMASVVNLADFCLVAAGDTLRFQTQYSLTRRSVRNSCQLLMLNSLVFPPEILGFDIGNDVVVWCMFIKVLYRHAVKTDARGGRKCSSLRRYLLPSVTKSVVDVIRDAFKF